MTDKLNITIRIADQPPMRLKILPQDEEIVRKAQSNINELWSRWCERFNDKTPGEVLAMVTFRFAQMYFTAESQSREASEVIADLESSLDRLLLDPDE